MFEYKVERVRLNNTHASEDQLNGLGKDGWEIVSTAVSSSDFVIIFQREVREAKRGPGRPTSREPAAPEE